MRHVLALAALALGLASAQAAPAGVLTIRFLDVGQGDAVLITSPEDKSLVYDGGRSESRMRDLIRQYDIRNVGLVAASHADSDHITGLIPIVALNKPQFFLNNGLAGNTQVWKKLTGVVAQAGTKGLVAADQVLNLGSVRVTVLAPPPGMKPEQNLHSVGLLVEYGAFRALMTGDSETPETAGWLRKYAANQLGPINVYKSIHHGAANGDNAAWLAAVRPQNVVISVGPNNYGHPTQKAIDLYKSAGASIYRTDLQGTITVTVTPTAFTVTPERGTGPWFVGSRGASPVAQPQPAARPVPAPAAGRATPPNSPQPQAQPTGGAVYYANCAAVRAAGAAPLRVGQPGYRRGLDRDGDGVACE